MNIVYHDWQNNTCTWEPGVDYEAFVVGQIHGVLFRKRGPNDNHVCMWHMVEDDGIWHVDESSCGSSSFWVDDMIQVWTKAKQWLVANCAPDPSGYGYIFTATN